MDINFVVKFSFWRKYVQIYLKKVKAQWLEDMNSSDEWF